MARSLTESKVLPVLAKALNKWILFVGQIYDEKGCGADDPSFDAERAVKCLGKLLTILDGPTFAEAQYVICDSKQEAMHLFEEVVGDEGPTEKNPYSGPYRAYAELRGPDGECYGENT